MKIRQIRNATLIVNYAGTRFLIDPMLSEKGAIPPFPGAYDDTTANPLVDLPVAVEEILNVDAVIRIRPVSVRFRRFRAASSKA